MTELFTFAKKILENQAFSRLLGTELVLFEEGRAELELVIRDELKQQHGFVHGGVISYLADNCLTYAGGSVLGNSVTAEYKINYLRPAKGERLLARASIIYAGKSQATCECKIYVVNNSEEKLVAVAQGTINKIDYKM